MDKLKPCPFCGAGAEYDHVCREHNLWLVICKTEACQSRGNIYNDEEGAIAAWNTRTAPANPPLTLDELREMDGKRVWVVSKNGDAARDWPGDWHTVDIENRWLIDRRNRCWTIHNDPANDQFIAYRHKPERGNKK